LTYPYQLTSQYFRVGLATGVSQAAAFFKLWLVARYFGVSAELDGYYLAFVVPSVVTGVLSGAIQTGLFPVHASLRARGRDDLARELVRKLLLLHIVAGFFLAMLLAAFGPWLASVLVDPERVEQRRALELVLPFAAITMAVTIVVEFAGHLLALRGRYVIAAAAPIGNALVGCSVLIAWSAGGLSSLVWGTVAGVLAQLGVVAAGALMTGSTSLVSSLRVVEPGRHLGEVARLGAWMLPGLICANLTLALPTILLTHHGDGAVAAFGYAFRLHQSTLQILVIGFSPVLLARLSQLVVQRDWTQLRQLQELAARASTLLGVAAVAIVALAGTWFLEAVFAYGSFDAVAARRVGLHWLWLTIGLGVAVFGNVLAKRLQAEGRSDILSLIAACGTAMVLLVGVLTGPQLGEYAAPAALTSASAATTVLLSRFVVRVQR
jgi:peptidoglycan biosynthesis protein MviN/MurJ (putative lipid II flippase)